MSLTIVRESSPNTNDVSLSQIEESDLDSEVDESEIKSSQGDLKMQTSGEILFKRDLFRLAQLNI